MSDWLWIWSVSPLGGISCGAEMSCRVSPGEPVLLIRAKDWPAGVRAKVRCERHWPSHAVPDLGAIQAARVALQREQQARPAVTPRPIYRHRPGGFQRLDEVMGSRVDRTSAVLGERNE